MQDWTVIGIFGIVTDPCWATVKEKVDRPDPTVTVSTFTAQEDGDPSQFVLV